MEDGPSNSKRARVDEAGANVSEAEILRLVAERESHRQARRFADSDAIREELRSMGVELYDKEKEWRCRDGRRGMLFTAGPMECTLSDYAIQDKINSREEARKTKDWQQADSLRDELRRQGVELDDKESMWRTSGGRSGSYSGGPRDTEANDDHIAHIRKLVAERERFRASQDFDSADEMRRQLLALGVEVYDNDRVWKSSDGLQGVIITGGHEVDCHLHESDIMSQVTQREEARSNKNWSQADSIRDDLRRAGVELLDNSKTWVTTDGRQGSYGGYSSPVVPNTIGSSSGRGHPGPPDTVPGYGVGINPLVTPPSVGTNLVQQQAAAGYALLQQLQAQAQIQHAQSATSSLSQGGGSMARDTGAGVTQATIVAATAAASNPNGLTFCDASIISLITGRERAREKHDWDTADAIRADLRSHGVEVWDKEKVWRANDGRHGSWR
eukprot:TRINITY_DN6919_c0_g1_i3.p1 TRINITY_DN6919_c0_g1~~TRINITY_DN6919_c0_g1_i3.p1  ORF type:complete len:475 (-),score=95.70 TRINITY_DN6919_c0_g1_i3:197-1525(-)